MIVIILNPHNGELKNGIWSINFPQNIPYPSNVKYISENSNLNTLKELLNSYSPNDGTPLTKTIKMINKWTETIKTQLVNLNLKIILIVITDGLPTEN